MNILQIFLAVMGIALWISVIILLNHDRNERNFYKNICSKLLLDLTKKT
jgi:hypothetical protein